MRMRELIKKTGLAERQVRFLVAQGFIPPPHGGRATADYGDDHVSAILRYMRLKELGFPPAAIRLLLDAKEGVPVTIEPGITLVIASERLGEDLNIAALEKCVSSSLQKIFKHRSKGQKSDA
jgi:MerR family copper efflux transcriptional regulator